MPLAREQRRLAAIVFIDVVGYSRLMGRNESGTHALVKTHLAERVEPTITRQGGRVVKTTGDGVLAEFGSAVEALSATILLQQEMAERKPQPAGAGPDRIPCRRPSWRRDRRDERSLWRRREHSGTPPG